MKTLSNIDPKLIGDINSAVQRKSTLEAKVDKKKEDFLKSIKEEAEEIESLDKTLSMLEQKFFGSSNDKPQNGKAVAKPKKKGKKPAPQKGTPRGATKQKVVDFLKKNPKGASQTEIAKETEIAASYVNYILRDNEVFSKKRNGRRSTVTLTVAKK